MAMVQNGLIARLPRVDRNHLLAICVPVDLVLAEVLSEPATRTKHVYFPIDGFVSLVALIDSGRGVEVGMVGREGMVGSELGLGVAIAPLHALVQGSGLALRITAPAFAAELARSQPLRAIVDRHLYVLLAQLAVSAACTRFHDIGSRLARWLLMSHDRAHADHFYVTQQFLAYMLGVRRVGVTVAAGNLQRAGLIRYRRGDFSVIDRAGLEAVACSCYAASRRTHASLLT